MTTDKSTLFDPFFQFQVDKNEEMMDKTLDEIMKLGLKEQQKMEEMKSQSEKEQSDDNVS